MMSEPSEMRSRFQPIASITTATAPSTSGTEAATTMPVRQPRLTRLTASTMTSASSSERSNSHTASFTTSGWSATRSSSTPYGSSPWIFADGGVDRLAELDDVAVVGHHDAEHQHLLAVVADRVGRRILEAARDGGEVAELDEPPAGLDRHVADVVEARELAAHAHEHAIAAACRSKGPASTAFCARRLSAIASGVMPRAARRSCENST